MNLGAFSVSLSVKDIATSRAFYENLGFAVIGGDETSWVILKNGGATIGLFHGMFEGNILTFNPRWTSEGEEDADGDDIRTIRSALVASGITPDDDSSASTDAGPASFTLIDPDGNAILVDQHV